MNEKPKTYIGDIDNISISPTKPITFTIAKLPEDWVTLNSFCKKRCTLFTPENIRRMYQEQKSNGSDYFIIKLANNRLLISPTLFFEWLEINKGTKIKEKS